MLGAQQIVTGNAVHLTCPLALEDDVAFTSGVLDTPPQVLLVAKNNTVEVYDLPLPRDGGATSCSSSTRARAEPCTALRSMGHIVDFGCPVLAMTAITHQCFVVWTTQQELVILRYQANLSGGREDVIGQGPSCNATLEKLKQGLCYEPTSDDWTAEAGQHWRGLHHRLHWMIVYSRMLEETLATQNVPVTPCATPQLAVLNTGALTAVLAHVYEGVVHRITVKFRAVMTPEKVSQRVRSLFSRTQPHTDTTTSGVFENFYSDRWTGLNVSADYTSSTVRAPQPYASSGLSCGAKGETTASRRRRLIAQWESFSYQDIADEELLTNRTIRDLSNHKAELTAHLPSWHVRRDSRLPEVAVHLTYLRAGHGPAQVVPIPGLHALGHPTAWHWLLLHVYKPHLCVYRHIPGDPPDKLQCFQKPHARAQGCPAYLALAVPAAEPALGLLVLFHHTPDGAQRVRVEALDKFTLDLEAVRGEAVASCETRAVSALLLEPTRTLWVALADGTLSCVPVPAPITGTPAEDALAGGVNVDDCEARPWPAAPPVRGLPSHFRVRRVLPLHLERSTTSGSAAYLFAATSRFAIFEDQLAEAVLVDLVALTVVASVSGSAGAMTDVCEGANASLVVAHVGGQLGRLTAVVPTSLVARLHATEAAASRESLSSSASSSWASCMSFAQNDAPSLAPADTPLAEHVDAIYPLLLQTSRTKVSDLYLLASLDTNRSELYRAAFVLDSGMCQTGEPSHDVRLVSLRRVTSAEIANASGGPAGLLLTSSTVAALATHGGEHVVQCTLSQLIAFGHVMNVPGPISHAALTEVSSQGCVAALVSEVQPNDITLMALTPQEPQSLGTTHTLDLHMEGPVAAVAVAAVAVSSAQPTQGRDRTWLVCVVAALWTGTLHVHLLHHHAQTGWEALMNRVAAAAPPCAAGTQRAYAPCELPLVLQSFSLIHDAHNATADVWRLQWSATARASHFLGQAAPAQLVEVCVDLRTPTRPDLESVHWLCLPSAEGPSGLPPLAQVSSAVLAIDVEAKGSLATVCRRSRRGGGLHLAVMHECYAEFITLASCAVHEGAPQVRPVASIRVDAHVGTDAGTTTHWRACAAVECAYGRDANSTSTISHYLFTSSTQGGLAVVALPDVLVRRRVLPPPPPRTPVPRPLTPADSDAVWELSMHMPTRYLRTQWTRLPGMAPLHALVRVLPAVPVLSLGDRVTLCPHVCCIDRGANCASLLMGVCPVRLAPVDALQLRQTAADGTVQDLVATCMARVPGREWEAAEGAATAPGSEIMLVGACAARPLDGSTHARASDARGTPTASAQGAPEDRHWLLVLTASPLRVVQTIAVPVTGVEEGPGGATAPAITDMSIYRRPPPPAQAAAARTGASRGASHRRGLSSTPDPAANDDCVLVVVAGGTSVFLYELYGHALVALSQVRCRAPCTSVAFSYPSVSVGMGGDGFAFLWVVSLTEDAPRVTKKLMEGDEEKDEAEGHVLAGADVDMGDGDAIAAARAAVCPPVALRGAHSVDDLNAILHRSDTRDALGADDDDGSEMEEADAELVDDVAPRDDGTTPFNPEEERQRRFGQSKMATLFSVPRGLSLVIGAYEPTVFSGGTRQVCYRERFVRTDDHGGVYLVYPHPPTSLKEMNRTSVGMHGGTTGTLTHTVRLPSAATAITVASPLRCRAVRRTMPRALQWSERWVALCAAGAGPRTILLPCGDGSLHALTEVPYGLAHPLLRLEQALTDMYTYRLQPVCTAANTADEALAFVYHTKPYTEETSLRSAGRLVPKQGVVGLDALRSFFAWKAHIEHLACDAPEPRAAISLAATVETLESLLYDEYGEELTLDDCAEIVSSI